MPDHDPRAIANEFLQRAGGPLRQMRLQKLIYIAHGWNLAINREPLVSGAFEAWDGGPVLRVVWDHLRDFGYNGPHGKLASNIDQSPFSAELGEAETGVINNVWKQYGKFSGLRLSEMTHKPGTPWSNAYFGSGRNSDLDNADIMQHFTELAKAGRARRAGRQASHRG